MRYKEGLDKNQLTFAQACPDDYVPENHICRVITAFTGQLDMIELGYKYAKSKATGCPPYDPRMMLNLYIYGYLNRIRSSRRLHAETTRNLEVIWLMDGLMPDDKTICNFRKDNTAALRKTFRAFTIMFRELGLFGGELIATDGTKFRADNSRKHNHNKIMAERELSRLDKKISEYMNALNETDSAEEKEDMPPSEEQIKAALEKLNQRKEKFEVILKQIESEGEISTVDPDSRLMRSGGDARALDVCYNVQTAVDSKHHLIVDFDVTNHPKDTGHLQDMSERAKEIMGTEALTNLADKGYYDGEDIVACEQSGVTCLVAKPKAGGERENFVYDRENDCYNCPCLNQLKYMRNQKHNNGKEYRVYANYAGCGKCLKRGLCTKAKHREILRLPYQDVLDTVDKRTQNNKELYRRRQEIVEHPFGTIKAVWGYKQFLCRTKPKVTAETALAYLAYNFRRVINIFTGNKVNLTTATGI